MLLVDGVRLALDAAHLLELGLQRRLLARERVHRAHQLELRGLELVHATLQRPRRRVPAPRVGPPLQQIHLGAHRVQFIGEDLLALRVLELAPPLAAQGARLAPLGRLDDEFDG